MRIKNIINFVVSLVFPETCLGCGEDNVLFCQKCIKQIKLRDDKDAHESLAVYEYIDNIWIATDYKSDIIHKLVEAVKFHGSRQAGNILGEIVYNFWQKLNISEFYFNQATHQSSEVGNLCLVPLPLHTRRRLERGYNQSELIAEVLANKLDLSMQNVLVRSRYTNQQLKLDASGRRDNVKNCFVINKKSSQLDFQHYIIVDDVVTTGATLNDAARALKAAGAKQVDVLVVAKNKW